MKLPDDVFYRRVNVAVVELKIVEYGDVWVVVDKLGPLIEEGAVILICLNDKMFTAAAACRD